MRILDYDRAIPSDRWPIRTDRLMSNLAPGRRHDLFRRETVERLSAAHVLEPTQIFHLVRIARLEPLDDDAALRSGAHAHAVSGTNSRRFAHRFRQQDPPSGADGRRHSDPHGTITFKVNSSAESSTTRVGEPRSFPGVRGAQPPPLFCEGRDNARSTEIDGAPCERR